MSSRPAFPLSQQLLLAFWVFFLAATLTFGLTKGRVLGLTISVTTDEEINRSADLVDEAETPTLATFPDQTQILSWSRDLESTTAVVATPTQTQTPPLDPGRLIIVSVYFAWGLTASLAFLIAVGRICRPRLRLSQRRAYLRLLSLALLALSLWLIVGACFVVLS